MHPLGHDTVGATAQADFLGLTASITETTLVSGTDLDGLGRLFAVAPLRSMGPTSEGYLLVGQERMLLMADAEDVVAQEFRFLVSAGLLLIVMAWLFGHYALVRTSSTPEWVEETR
jgi:hypothetical protein